MFCPSCGFEYAQKTNYCKRCGEELNAAPQGDGIGPRRFQAAGIFAIVALFGAVGLLMNLVSHYKLIQRLNVRPDDAMVSLALGLLLVGGVSGLLIWQLSRLITAFQKSTQAPAQERMTIREARASHLGAPTDPIQRSVEPSSVVEHTTRQMAGVYSAPNAQE